MTKEKPFRCRVFSHVFPINPHGPKFQWRLRIEGTWAWFNERKWWSTMRMKVHQLAMDLDELQPTRHVQTYGNYCPNPPSPIPIISNVTSWREVGLWFRLETAPSHPFYDKHSVTNTLFSLMYFPPWVSDFQLTPAFSQSTQRSQRLSRRLHCRLPPLWPSCLQETILEMPSMWESGNPMIH